MAELAMSLSLCLAVLFVDVAQAFSSVVRALAFTGAYSDAEIAYLFSRLNLGGDSLHELAEILACSAACDEAKPLTVGVFHHSLRVTSKYDSG